MGSVYWKLVAIGGVLTLARFSEAFLILKAQSTGLRIAFIPLVLVGMNIVYATAAYPAGILSDRWRRKTVLLMGIVFLIMADIALSFADNFGLLSLGIGLWGLHMAFTQGLLAHVHAGGQRCRWRLVGSGWSLCHIHGGCRFCGSIIHWLAENSLKILRFPAGQDELTCYARPI